MSNYKNEVSLLPAKKASNKMPSNISKDMGKNNQPKKIKFGQVINKEGGCRNIKTIQKSHELRCVKNKGQSCAWNDTG